MPQATNEGSDYQPTDESRDLAPLYANNSASPVRPLPIEALADAMPHIVFVAGGDGFISYYNRVWFDYTGLSAEQSRGWGWGAVLHPDDLEFTLNCWTEATTTEAFFQAECRLRRARDGGYRWHEMRAVPVRDAAGALTHWVGSGIDVHEAKEAMLRASREMARISERERTIVDALQNTLVPSLPEGVPGLDLAAFYRAAMEEANIGGDFSDVFPVEKGCYMLVVGDLAGKGLSAAAQVSTVRNMLRYAVYTAPTIAQAITGLNRILVLNRLLDGFATLVVGTFDFNARTLTYVSCGQEPALLRRRADGEVEELGPTGPVLGAFEGATYKERVVPLVAGDTFVLYTDGITESGPSRADMLGIEGLIALLKRGAHNAEGLLQEIVTGVDTHANGHILDDMCLLVGVVRADSTPGLTETLDAHHPSESPAL